MTVTPPAQGTPDMYADISQYGKVLVNSSFAATTNSGLFGITYVGNLPSFLVVGTFTGGPSVAYFLKVFWSLTNSYTAFYATELYLFNPSQLPLIADCLVVIAPYVFFQYVTNDGGAASVSLRVTSCQQSRRSAAFIPNEGLCIVGTLTVATGTSGVLWGSFISPGLYSYSIAVTTAITGTIWVQQLNTIGVGVATAATIVNPAVNTNFVGTFVAGTNHLFVQFSNSSGANRSISVGIIGPQVT